MAIGSVRSLALDPRPDRTAAGEGAMVRRFGEAIERLQAKAPAEGEAVH
jgi:hypothetical protein